MPRRLSSDYISNVYEEFKSLKGAELREIIRFYEENKEDINALELNEFFDLQVSYLCALFEFNEFDKFLYLVDEAIEASIYHNIQFVDHENIYNKLLYLKAEAHHYQMDYGKAAYIFEELIKIDPYKEKYANAFGRTHNKLIPKYLKNSRAISIVFFILTAVVIAAELLIIRNFAESWITLFEWTRNSLFILGWLTLITGELIHYWRVEQLVSRVVSKYKNLKSFKKKY